MNQEQWNKSSGKKLFDCFMEIEKSQYPDFHAKTLEERRSKVEKLILEFGASFVTVENYTNMMQFYSRITIDTFRSGGFKDGDILVRLGSEPYELWANRVRKDFSVIPCEIPEMFDFTDWQWKLQPQMSTGSSQDDEENTEGD